MSHLHMFLVVGPVWLVIEIWSGVGAPAVEVDLFLVLALLKPKDSMERLLRL